jgi:PAS domain-containing protein
MGLLQHHAMNLFHPEHFPAIARRLANHQEGELEATALCPDGRVLELRIQFEPVLFHSRPLRLVLLQDVTATRHSQDRLQQSAIVFENASEGILVTDDQGHITGANRAFTRITGYTEVEVLGKTPRLLHSGRPGDRILRGHVAGSCESRGSGGGRPGIDARTASCSWCSRPSPRCPATGAGPSTT